MQHYKFDIIIRRLIFGVEKQLYTLYIEPDKNAMEFSTLNNAHFDFHSKLPSQSIDIDIDIDKMPM